VGFNFETGVTYVKFRSQKLLPYQTMLTNSLYKSLRCLNYHPFFPLFILF
jgi:hypothetical protein